MSVWKMLFGQRRAHADWRDQVSRERMEALATADKIAIRAAKRRGEAEQLRAVTDHTLFELVNSMEERQQ